MIENINMGKTMKMSTLCATYLLNMLKSTPKLLLNFISTIVNNEAAVKDEIDKLRKIEDSENAQTCIPSYFWWVVGNTKTTYMSGSIIFSFSFAFHYFRQFIVRTPHVVLCSNSAYLASLSTYLSNMST